MIVLVIALTACGSSKTVSGSYVREEVDFAFMQRIAVLPFENNSKDATAPERARDITITQVLAIGLYDTVEKSLVNNILYEEAIDPEAPIDPLSLKRIGQRLDVQAFLVGTVDLAGTNKVGTAVYPELALTLRLIEANSGMILWQASGSYSGESLGVRLFGMRAASQYQITHNLVRTLLKTAPSGVFE
jgi:TolB-like protein